MIIFLLALSALVMCLLASDWMLNHFEQGGVVRQFCTKSFGVLALGGVMLSFACSVATVVGQLI